MYSTFPLINQGVSVIGIIWMCVLWGLVSFAAYGIFQLVENGKCNLAHIIVSMVSGLILPGAILWGMHDAHRDYKNEPVEATFIGYQPEINKSGKYVSHTLYVIFQVPEGQVVLPIQPGQPIASKVILYRN